MIQCVNLDWLMISMSIYTRPSNFLSLSEIYTLTQPIWARELLSPDDGYTCPYKLAQLKEMSGFHWLYSDFGTIILLMAHLFCTSPSGRKYKWCVLCQNLPFSSLSNIFYSFLELFLCLGVSFSKILLALGACNLVDVDLDPLYLLRLETPFLSLLIFNFLKYGIMRISIFLDFFYFFLWT